MNLYASLLRTVVPLLAGFLITYAARAGFDLSDSAAHEAVTAAVAAAYYAVFRGLEDVALRRGWSRLARAAGAALGWAHAPEYPAKAPQHAKGAAT